MADFVKRKIVEKLARYTKDLKPSDISLSFLSGKGQLYNLELNALFITEVLQLPPWIKVSRVVCDKIKGHVPFTNLKTEPVTFYVGTVTIEVSTCTEEGSRTTHSDLMKKLSKSGGKSSKYGFTEKVIDGMRVEICSIVIQFHDPTFHAQLQMNDIVIRSTNSKWGTAQSLAETRHVIADEESVIIYKMASWTSVKLEGWSTSDPSAQAEHHNSRIRLLSQDSQIRIAFKRNLLSSSIMATKVSVILGDLIWILTQSQLRAVSKLVQSLMQAAVKAAQLARQEKQDSDRESVDSTESTISTQSSEFGGARQGQKGSDAKKKQSSTKKSMSANQRAVKQRMSDYREGKQSLPEYEVIQHSFHFRSGKIELQLCDDTEESHTAQGSMLLQLCELVVDVYTDQQAGAGRAHWNEANDLTTNNRKWSRELIQKASKTQFMDFPSVDLIKLRERGVVIKCSDFSISALKSGQESSGSSALPVLTCDKKTFNIPDDFYNPAFQVGLTFYHYPSEYSSQFSAPRPNLFVQFTPLHINLDQRSFLWLVEFIYGVVKTVNMELAVSVHDEGKSYLESRKTESVDTYQLPGVDSTIKILFSKITIPLPGEVVVEDGRPKALQVETSAIIIENHALESLLINSDFKNAMKQVKQGWVFKTQDTAQFPHFLDDVQSFPVRLAELINYVSQKEFVSSAKQLLQNDEDKSKKLDLSTMEGWYIHTGCVHISFAESYTHEATLYTTQFVDDFPAHLWLFPPRLTVDSNQFSGPSTPSGSPEPLSHSNDPFLSFLAHAPNVIQVELNRAQLLFLMRLKDSITLFKNHLMDFLDTSVIIPPKRTTSPAKDSLKSASDDSDATEKPKTLSGCVVVESVQANILLPSIFSPKEEVAADSLSPTVSEVADQPVFVPTNLDMAKKTVGVSVSPQKILDDSVPVDIQLEPSSVNFPSSSTSSFVVNIPPTPAQMSPIDMIDKYSESTPNLPHILTPKAPIPRMYNSASNLTSLPSSSTHTGTEKAQSSYSLSSLLTDRSTGTGSFPVHTTMTPSPSPSPYLASAMNSESSSDDFVIVENVSPLSTALTAQTLASQFPSMDISHTKLEVSPISKKTDAKETRRKRQARSPPPLSERKVKSSSPSRSEPQYILCISVDGIHALPNIVTSGAITARCNVNNIDIREVKNKDYSKYKEELMSKRIPQQDQNRDECVHPVIKLRVEIGDQVVRFFDQSVTEADAILILKATGLELGLLTQNMDVMKQFFDDEFESELPIPIHIRVDNTKLTILESPESRLDDWKCMQVKVNQADIHRGKSLASGLNIFMDSGQTLKTLSRMPSVSSTQQTTSLPELTEDQSQDIQDSAAQLLDSFKAFIKQFEFHMKLHGSTLQPDHIAEVLAELQTVKANEINDRPPSYSKAVSVVLTSHVQSSSDSNTEVIRLRRENEELRQLQFDRDKLNLKLVDSQSKLEQNLVDLDMVTEECKKAKEELNVYKQVLERQHERMESLLNENFDLKKRLGML